MSKDETWLRELWRRHLYRHQAGFGPSTDILIKTKWHFWQTYGWDELIRICREVELEVAKEMIQEYELSKVQSKGVGMVDNVQLLPALARKTRKPRWSIDLRRQRGY